MSDQYQAGAHKKKHMSSQKALEELLTVIGRALIVVDMSSPTPD